MRKHILRSLLYAIAIITPISLFATNHTTTSNGSWKNVQNWDANGLPGTYWSIGDTIFIKHNIDLDQNIGFAGTLIIEDQAKLKGSSKSMVLYENAQLISNGDLEIKNLSINKNSSATVSGIFSTTNDLTIGQNAQVLFHTAVDIGGSFTNNEGNATFNQAVTIDGHFDSNSGQVDFQKESLIKGHFNLNSGASVLVDHNSTLHIKGQLLLNNNAVLSNKGKMEIDNHAANTGGFLENQGLIVFNKQFTQNNGLFTNDGIAMIHQHLTINGQGTVDGIGLIRSDKLTVYGSLSGSNDICSLDDSNLPAQNGSGIISSNTSYCQQSLSAALPIELEFFKAQWDQGELVFEWRTLSELNNDYFSVEFSEGGRNFTSILKIKGAGTSNHPINYSEQSNVHKGSGYYRLKQTDFDGKFNYSDVVFVTQSESLKTINAYPNPNDGRRLFIELEGLSAAHYQIDLLNSRGEMVKSKEIIIEKESLYFETELLHGTQLQSGVYYLRISSTDERFMKKIIVP